MMIPAPDPGIKITRSDIGFLIEHFRNVHREALQAQFGLDAIMAEAVLQKGGTTALLDKLEAEYVERYLGKDMTEALTAEMIKHTHERMAERKI